MIAENMASGSVTAFKRQNFTLQSVPAGLPNAASQTGNKFHMPALRGGTNFEQGQLYPSGEKTDMALDGPGFFEVRMPDGSAAYTRNGEFKVSSDGFLITKHGHQVMSENGPVELDIKNRDAISISTTGEIIQGRNRKGSLKIVEFDDTQKLSQLGGGLFLATDPNIVSQKAENTSVYQGTLESSNLSPMTEMAEMINVMRMFEANQKIVQMNDDRMEKAITNLSGNA